MMTDATRRVMAAPNANACALNEAPATLHADVQARADLMLADWSEATGGDGLGALLTSGFGSGTLPMLRP